MATTEGTDATGNLRWTIEKDYGHIEVDLVGEFDEHSGPEFEAVVRQLSVGRRREFSVNLVGLTFSDSSFLRVMLNIHAECGHVALLNPSTKLARTLEVAGIDQILVVRNDHRNRDRA